jgi:branched-chain amino acid transport system permease protein
MELAIAMIINSLVLSSMYILVALGFALLFSIAGILNFAHGTLYMLGGYICWAFSVKVGLNPWLAMLLAMIIMAAIGILLEKFCFRPFWGDFNRTLVVVLAIIIILETGTNLVIGAAEVSAIPHFAGGMIDLGGVASVSKDRLLVFIIGGVLLAVMMWFISRTRRGLQIQAIAQNLKGAALQGINIYGVAALTCALGSALAAVAGSLMGSLYYLDPFMGDLMLLKIVEVVILGGLGSIGGVLAGGLMLGIIDASLPQVMSGAACQAVGLVIIIIFLLFRPQGFFGRMF